MPTTLQRLGAKAYSAYTATQTALPPPRPSHPQWPATVAAAHLIAPQVRRITLQAAEFRDYRASGPDEYFGLLMPPAGRDLVLPQDRDTPNVRAALREMPEQTRPDLRWYTIRGHRPDLGQVDVDIVLHGDDGPGSAWATRTQRGDQVGFKTGDSTYRPPGPDARRLITADETSAPALAGICRSLNEQGVDPDRVFLFLEVPDDDHAPPLDTVLPVRRVIRGSREPGAALLQAVQQTALPELDYAWLCGEAKAVAALRRHALRQGLSRRRIMYSGYWNQGKARG